MFETIRQSLANVEYGWNQPSGYLVLVPGLCPILQNIQVTELSLGLSSSPDLNLIDLYSRKFYRMCQWHGRGAVVQALVASVATTLFGPHIAFQAIGALAMWQLIQSIKISVSNKYKLSFYTLNPNGTIKSAESCNPLPL